jgi:hypothetical protein
VSVLCKVLLASLRTMIDTLEDAEEDFDFDLEGLDLTTPSGSTSSSAPSSSPSSEDAKSAASADNNDNEPLQAHEFIPLYFDISNLRYKERDGLEAAVRGWMDDKVVDMKMQELFEYRLRRCVNDERMRVRCVLFCLKPSVFISFTHIFVCICPYTCMCVLFYTATMARGSM